MARSRCWRTHLAGAGLTPRAHIGAARGGKTGVPDARIAADPDVHDVTYSQRNGAGV